MILPLIIIIIFPILFVYFILPRIKSKKSLIPPGPPGLPLVGNLHQFGTKTNLQVYLWQLSKKYGPLTQLKLGHVTVLIVSSAKLAKEVLKTQDLSFCSRAKHLAMQKLSYSQVDIAFAPYSDYWREVKKITLVHLLSSNKIQSFCSIRDDEVSRMVKMISGFVNSGQVVNLSEVVKSVSSTLLCRVAFGKRYNEQGAEIQRFHGLLQEAQAFMVSFFVSDYFPSLSWIDKLSGSINRLEIVCKKLDLFYQELIDEHLNPNKEKNDEDHEDILDILIRLREDRSNLVELSWNSIKALLMNIFIAGTDTTAASVIWTLTALIKAPNVMKKLQEEIREAVGPKGRVDEDDLLKLSYLKAVINESLRLYPPGPLLVPRETIRKCILEGYEIEPKTVVYVNARAIARDPENWENAHEFLPERFLNTDIDVKGQDFRVIPFGSGRRICPGLFMGFAHVELIVANLMYAFDWDLPLGIHAGDVDTDCLPGLTMNKKEALYLVPKRFVG